MNKTYCDKCGKEDSYTKEITCYGASLVYSEDRSFVKDKLDFCEKYR